jgi:hypothetical protein
VLVNSGNVGHFSFVEDRLAFGLSTTGLLNSGTTVSLLAPGQVLVDRVSYDLTWYGDPGRDDGGWSLEQIDPFKPCSSARNWAASNAPEGGTPGSQNSLFDPTPDVTAPALLTAFIVGDDQVEITFDEPMDTGSLLEGSFTVEPDLGISTIQPLPGDQRVLLTLAQEPLPGVFYTVRVVGVTDCVGNPIGGSNEAVFAYPEPLSAGDVVVNEVMYDPATGSSEFVELYNRSTKVIDLMGTFIGREPGDLQNRKAISSTPWLLLPGTYVVLTANITAVLAHYPQSRSDRFIQMSLSSLPNTGGTVSFLDAQGAVVDVFRYDPSMHFDLVSNTKGYSLERIDPERSTADATNWQTAADNAGRATPGYRNSQYAAAPQPAGSITIDPAIFSPDNDGHQDVLTITYAFDSPGFAGTLMIFDVAGREVRRLMDNELLGTRGAISWDGLLDDGSKGRMGAYIVVLEAFDLEGRVERLKRTVTLAHYLDRP